MTAPSANATPTATAFNALRQDAASRLRASSSEEKGEFRKRRQGLFRTAIVASVQHAFGMRLRSNIGYRLSSNCNRIEPLRRKLACVGARWNVKPC